MSFLENAKEISPCVLLIDNAIDNAQEIINKAMIKANNGDSGVVEDATIFVPEGLPSLQKEIRNTKKIDIAPSFTSDVFWWLLSQKLWNYGDAYGKKYNIGFSTMENPQFLWYKKNEGFYKPHADGGGTIRRCFSFVLYLNDVEEGGETHFERLDISVKPKAGRLIIFPAEFTHLHGAKIPISDDKFVVVTWFHY